MEPRRPPGAVRGRGRAGTGRDRAAGREPAPRSYLQHRAHRPSSNQLALGAHPKYPDNDSRVLRALDLRRVGLSPGGHHDNLGVWGNHLLESVDDVRSGDFHQVKTTHEPGRPSRPPAPRPPVPLRGEGATAEARAGSPPRSAINHLSRAGRAPPRVPCPADGKAPPRALGAPLVRVPATRGPALPPGALPPGALPPRGLRASPPLRSLQTANGSGTGLGRASPGARPPSASRPQVPRPVPGSPARRRRRAGGEAGGGGGGELTARPEAAGCRLETASAGARAAEAASERCAAAVDAAGGERDPRGRPQCPGATPSPLEDPGTMPKFGGNWGQCPVVLLDAGEALPTSWRTGCWAKRVGGARREMSQILGAPGPSRETKGGRRAVPAARGAGNNAHGPGTPGRALCALLCG